jgi:hypothetical protein
MKKADYKISPNFVYKNVYICLYTYVCISHIVEKIYTTALSQ